MGKAKKPGGVAGARGGRGTTKKAAPTGTGKPTAPTVAGRRPGRQPRAAPAAAERGRRGARQVSDRGSGRSTKSAGPGAGSKARTRKVASQRKTPKTKRRVTSRARSAQKGRTRLAKPVHVPAVTYRIKPLDPLRKCGVGTSVQSLYRVDELVDGALRHHMVFLDRHGWYCEHGRNCPAVTHARKFDEAGRPGPN